MPEIRICLFGPPRIEHNHRPLSLGVRKGIALIVYLAVTGQAHSRDALATLFWPESNQQEARASLRRMLYRLNQLFKSDVVMTERDLVQLNPTTDLWLDVAEFRRLTACLQSSNEIRDAERRQLEEAIELYADDFMAGFSLLDCAEFDDWQFFQREELRQLLAAALEQLMYICEEQIQYEQAIALARRWLALDRMHEPVHRHLMRLYARAGQQSAALRQYEECARILDEELGVEPDDETSELLEAIRLRRFPDEDRATAKAIRLASAAPPLEPVPKPAHVRYPLPSEPLPLVGRAVELAQLRNMLDNPRCRLITLVGLGGIGKTHLALAAAHRVVARAEAHTGAHDEIDFPDGVLFVTLADKATADTPVVSVILALSDAVGLSLAGRVEPAQQLLDFLRPRKMLIILDNFEELLHGSEEEAVYAESVLSLVEQILDQAVGVKLLVTSREPLQVQAEWRFDLQGLTYPTAEEEMSAEAETLQNYSAADLFAQFAQQVQPSFEMTPHNIPSIYRLCRLVAGSPLALKLAAAWVRIFTCERIVSDIEENMNLLSTQMRTIPLRQRSMRAIFDYTWRLLSTEEQRLFLAISVFRGGFTEGAATTIADATPHLLAALLDRGLIQVQSTVQGVRYTLHDLTRQYAAERLAAQPVYSQQIRDRYTAYYVDFVDGLTEAISGDKQPEALAAIHDEIDNVEMMWANLVAAVDLDSLRKVIEALWRYHWSRTPGQKGQQFITEAIHSVTMSEAAQAHPASGMLLRTLYSMRGGFHYFLGEYDLAQHDFQIALTLARQWGLRKEEMDVAVILSSIARWRGESEDAQTRLLEAAAFYKEVGYRDGEADALQELAQLYVYTGQYAEAKGHALQSLSISRELGRPDWIGWALDVLGWLSFSCGEYAEARRYYTESLSYFERINHQLGIALAWGGLGMLAWAAGSSRWAEAHASLERSLAICRHLNHQFHVSSRLSILAQISNDAEQYDQAERYAREGVEVAQKVESPLFIALNLCCLAESLYYRGALDRSRRYIRQAIQLAYEIGQMPALTIAILCYATSLVIESELAADAALPQTSSQVRALALLERVIEHPACWAIYREKSVRLLNEVTRKWPAEHGQQAVLYNRTHTFDAQIREILWGEHGQRVAQETISSEEMPGRA